MWSHSVSRAAVVSVYCCSSICIRAKQMVQHRNLFEDFQGTGGIPLVNTGVTNNTTCIVAVCIAFTPECHR